MTYETIQLEMRGAVCLLTLNRPDRLNALNVQVAHDFKAAVKEEPKSALSFNFIKHFLNLRVFHVYTNRLTIYASKALKNRENG